MDLHSGTTAGDRMKTSVFKPGDLVRRVNGVYHSKLQILRQPRSKGFSVPVGRLMIDEIAMIIGHDDEANESLIIATTYIGSAVLGWIRTDVIERVTE